MHRFEIHPLKSAGVIHIGMTRTQVAGAIGAEPEVFMKTPDSLHPTDGFFDSSVQVFYDGEVPIVEYIEFSRNKELEVVYEGISIFSTPATELIERIGADCDSDSEKNPSDVIFPDLAMSLWKPSADLGIQPDVAGFFQTFGIGRVGYFDT